MGWRPARAGEQGDGISLGIPLWDRNWHDKERDERVFASLNVPKTIEANLPFKQKQRVSVLNDPAEIDKRR